MPKQKTIFKRKHADPADLWAAYQQTRSIADRNRLVEFYANSGFVRAIALRLNMSGVGKEYSFNADDLESFGWHGLIRAVEQFEPGRGFAFRTYAGQKIVGAMLDGVRDEGDPRPRLIRDRRAKLNAIVETFAAEHGRKPTEAEVRRLVAKPGMSEGKVSCTLRDGLVDVQQVPIDIHYTTTGDTEPMRLLCHHTARQLQRLEDREEIDRCLDAMEETLREKGVREDRHRSVMVSTYLDGLKHEEAAELFDVCPSRISQIHVDALRIMQAFAFATRKAQAA